MTKTVLRGEKKKERDEIRDAIRRLLRDRHRGGLPRRCHSGRRHGIELNAANSFGSGHVCTLLIVYKTTGYKTKSPIRQTGNGLI